MTIARDIQPGLFEGDRDKAIGPLPLSVVYGSNSDLIASIAPLYLTGGVLDVTYGRGMWWRRFTPEPFARHDIEIDGVDFRALPEADSSWDTVCFDPPYVPRQGKADATTAGDQEFRNRFGLAESRGGVDLKQLIDAGLAECSRVARHWVLAKANDYTNGKQFHLGHLRIINEAERLGLRVHDLIIHASGTGPGGGQIHQVRRARRAHSYLIVLRVAR